jgi:hypothetical protein
MGTGVAFVLMGCSCRASAPRASFATYRKPVVALVLGVAFRDESTLVGRQVVLVIAGASSPAQTTAVPDW